MAIVLNEVLEVMAADEAVAFIQEQTLEEAWMCDQCEQDEHDQWELDCVLREMDERGLLGPCVERMLRDGWAPRWSVLELMGKEYQRQLDACQVPF